MAGSTLRQDIKYGLRILRQNPVFAGVAVTSLALGIGANTAIFTLVNAILLRSLPVQNPHELVVLARNPSQPTTAASYPDYCYLRDHSGSYAGLTAFWSGGVTSFRRRGADVSSEMVALALVSGNYFEVLGVPPVLGRVFSAGDDQMTGGHPYVVLSHAFWKRAFGGDLNVIGQDILLNNARLQVVGVARDGFTGTRVGTSPDVFAPIVMLRTFWPNDTLALTSRRGGWVTIMGRLRSGISLAKAESELNLLWQRILDDDPEQQAVRAWQKDYNAINTRVLLTAERGYSGLRSQVSRPLTILMITAGVVLLITCVNVSNLLLARCVARRKEIAVRLAVGANRSRILMQLLTESVTLSVLGGISGLVLAWASVGALLRFLPTGALSPVEVDLSPDARILGFTFILAILTAITFGFTPALRASRPDLVKALKSDTAFSGAGRLAGWNLRQILVSLQVGLCVVLLAGAGLFVRTLTNLRSLETGILSENLLFINTNMIQVGYQPQRARSFYERVLEEIERVPGVRIASTADISPLADNGRPKDQVQIEGYTWKPHEPRVIDMNAVEPRYFETTGIPIVQGRDFRASDSVAASPDLLARADTQSPDARGRQRVAIVNTVFARRFFSNRSAIGGRFCLGDKWDATKTYEIVGVVADAQYFNLRQSVEPMVYKPRYREANWSGGILCVRTDTNPKRIISMIRGIVQQIDSAVTVTEMHTMEDNIKRALVRERFVATVGGFFASLSLLLVAVGLYGVMSQAVTSRTREIGIRMALGAESRNVFWMVLRISLKTVVIGVVAGLSVVLVLMRYTESLLFGVTPQDPVSMVAAVVLLLTVSAAAGFLPALRATRVPPIEALRQE